MRTTITVMDGGHGSARLGEHPAQPPVGRVGAERRVPPEGLLERDDVPGTLQDPHTGRPGQALGQAPLQQRNALGPGDQEGTARKLSTTIRMSGSTPMLRSCCAAGVNAVGSW
jgi:hypothetical protein